MAETISPEITAGSVVDDLTKVVGIGPAVEQHLRKAGIVSYGQLGRMKPKKVASLLKDMKGFTEKRIVDEDWLGQAQRLAEQAGETQAEADRRALESSENGRHRQHYAVFTCELLLDRLNQVRRTRVMHVQSQQEVFWAGWVPGKLENFLAQSAQLSLLEPSGDADAARPDQAPEAVQDPRPELQVKSAFLAKRVLHGGLKITDFHLCDLWGEKLGVIVPASEGFSLRLTLDLQDISVETGEPLKYTAVLDVRSLESKDCLAASRSEGLLSLDEPVHEIEIQSQPLPPGDYKLDALVLLWPKSQAHSLRNQLSALVEGILVHCYEGDR